MREAPLFHPTFGSRPREIVGRDREIETMCSGLEMPVGSRERCTLLLGQRGMGKTALLLEIEDRAQETGFVVARVTHNAHMLDEIVELIQLHGASFIPERKRPVSGFNAGVLGFSFGLTFNEETQRNYGFRVKLGLLCDELDKRGKGVLILVDEASSSENMRQLATTYQNLVGEGKNIAIGMAGLPHAVSAILNDKVLTFLNRASKIKLGPISCVEIERYYAKAFDTLHLVCPETLSRQAAQETRGFPYLMQLIGYNLARYGKDSGRIDELILKQALASAKEDLDDSVFVPIVAAMSDVDLEFARAMAQDSGPSKTADIISRTNRTDSSFQPYRARLIDMGVVESPRRGELQFAVPFLDDYLRRKS